VVIKRSSVPEISFWAWTLKICYRPEHESGTKLVFNNGSWLSCDCSVDEVMVAVGLAMGIYTAIERQDQADAELVYDSPNRIGSRHTTDVF
jgi:hypothetical protein